MCQVFAGQDPTRYASVSRSVRLSGHATSIRLEAAFWAVLDDIAASQDISTPRFLSLLHDEVLELRGEVPNFTSLLRTTCLLHLSGARPALAEIADLSATTGGDPLCAVPPR